TPSSEPTNGRHPGIIPAIYMLFPTSFQKPSFAHHRIREVPTGKLVLSRWKYFSFFNKPVIEGAIRNKLQCTKRRRDFFNRVTLSMTKIIHRIDTPCISSTVMDSMLYAVEQRIAHVHVGICQINFSA